MKKIIMLKGLAASGKSTWAKKQVEKYRGSYTRVNKDDLRNMLHNGRWSKENEKLVLKIRDDIIINALERGQHIIVDDTNLHEKHKARLNQIANEYGAKFEEKFFDVEPKTCIKRDLKRINSVGAEVIMNMYNTFLKPSHDIYTPPVGRPKAIIVDIDGTLAHSNHRSPYDYTRVLNDTVDAKVKDLVNMYADQEITVVIVTGRANEKFGDTTVREMTRDWLDANEIIYDELWSREEGDYRKDTIIKREIFDECIRDKYNIEVVLDDRASVVSMWRELGLKVLQVADGNF